MKKKNKDFTLDHEKYIDEMINLSNKRILNSDIVYNGRIFTIDVKYVEKMSDDLNINYSDAIDLIKEYFDKKNNLTVKNINYTINDMEASFNAGYRKSLYGYPNFNTFIRNFNK